MGPAPGRTSTGPDICLGPGAGSYPCQPKPVTVSAIIDGAQLAACGHRRGALLSGREALSAGGITATGRRGADPTSIWDTDVPTAVGGTAERHPDLRRDNTACAVRSDGSIGCWGMATAGSSGTGSASIPNPVFSNCDGECTATPSPVLGISNATQVSVWPIKRVRGAVTPEGLTAGGGTLRAC